MDTLSLTREMSHKIPLAALLTICVLGVASVSAQKKPDRERLGLQGPVKSIESYVVECNLADGEVQEGKPRISETTIFARTGGFKERLSYDQHGLLRDRFVYTYDTQGRNTGYEEYSSILDKTLTRARRHVYTLDAEGNISEYRVFDSDGSVGARFTYKYDQKGNKTEDSFWSPIGEQPAKTVYTWDEQGNELSRAYYRADGTLEWKTISKRDSEGRVSEWLQYINQKLKYSISYSYDQKDRILESVTREFDANPNLRTSHAPQDGKVVYSYDDANRTKKVSTYGPDGLLKNREIYEYDARGNEIGVTRFNSDGSQNDTVIHFYDDISEPRSKYRGQLRGKSVFEFEYDANGNWTRKVYLIQEAQGAKGKPFRIEQRRITYY